jgi:hypothetical protein
MSTSNRVLVEVHIAYFAIRQMLFKSIGTSSFVSAGGSSKYNEALMVVNTESLEVASISYRLFHIQFRTHHGKKFRMND